MKTKDAVEFFGTQKALAEAIGITQPSVSLWGEEVPRSRLKSVEMAMKIEGDKRSRRAKKITQSKEIRA